MQAEMVFILLLTTLGQGTASEGVSAQDAPDRRASAQEEKSKDIAAGRRVGLEELKQAAARYRIVTDSHPPKNMVLVPEPVLRWSNPLRKTADGAVFIWVADGRPEVVG